MTAYGAPSPPSRCSTSLSTRPTPTGYWPPTRAGRSLEITSGGSIVTRPRTPHLVLLDWAAGESDDGQVVAVDGGGYLYRSEDRGQHWVPLAHVDGAPTALAVIGDTWYAATTGGLYRGHLDQDDALLVDLRTTP